MQLTITRDAAQVACLCVGVADTEDERTLGLTGDGDPAPFDGLAFLWQEPTRPGFWMKDTKGPLDVVFVGEDGIVSGVQTMPGCSTEPCQVFSAPGVVDFAVEVRDAAAVPLQRGDTAVLEGSCER